MVQVAVNNFNFPRLLRRERPGGGPGGPGLNFPVQLRQHSVTYSMSRPLKVLQEVENNFDFPRGLAKNGRCRRLGGPVPDWPGRFWHRGVPL